MIEKYHTYFMLRVKNRAPEFDAPIWLRIRAGRAVDYFKRTGLTIPVKWWDAKKEKPKCYVGSNQALADYLALIDGKLSKLEYEIKLMFSKHSKFSREIVDAIVRNVVESDTNEGSDAPVFVTDYCATVIEQMVSGERLVHAKNGEVKTYGANTVKSWRGFFIVLKDFCSGRGLTWDTISEADTSSFVSYLVAKGNLLPTTQNRYITTFKALIAMAAKDGLLKTPDAADGLHRVSAKGTGKETAKIYLTDVEIEALYNMPLELGSLKDRVRDIFCMGCYICQRISDYNHLGREMFTTTGNGLPVIKLVQQKTGQKVTIPILSPHITAIAEKYNYDMPTVADAVLNKYIKSICKELSKTVPSLAEKVPTTLTSRDMDKEKKTGELWDRTRDGRALVPRWNLVLSHTARRSGITNLYLSDNLTDAQIMSISGHTSQKNFEKYLLAGPDLVAEKIAEKLAETGADTDKTNSNNEHK